MNAVELWITGRKEAGYPQPPQPIAWPLASFGSRGLLSQPSSPYSCPRGCSSTRGPARARLEQTAYLSRRYKISHVRDLYDRRREREQSQGTVRWPQRAGYAAPLSGFTGSQDHQRPGSP